MGKDEPPKARASRAKQGAMDAVQCSTVQRSAAAQVAMGSLGFLGSGSGDFEGVGLEEVVVAVGGRGCQVPRSGAERRERWMW